MDISPYAIAKPGEVIPDKYGCETCQDRGVWLERAEVGRGGAILYKTWFAIPCRDCELGALIEAQVIKQEQERRVQVQAKSFQNKPLSQCPDEAAR